MAEFETACREADIPLYVLPPRPPKYNGGVERTGATTRYEYSGYRGPLRPFEAVYRSMVAYQATTTASIRSRAWTSWPPNEYLAQLGVAA